MELICGGLNRKTEQSRSGSVLPQEIGKPPVVAEVKKNGAHGRRAVESKLFELVCHLVLHVPHPGRRVHQNHCGYERGKIRMYTAIAVLS